LIVKNYENNEGVWAQRWIWCYIGIKQIVEKKDRAWSQWWIWEKKGVWAQLGVGQTIENFERTMALRSASFGTGSGVRLARKKLKLLFWWNPYFLSLFLAIAMSIAYSDPSPTPLNPLITLDPIFLSIICTVNRGGLGQSWIETRGLSQERQHNVICV